MGVMPVKRFWSGLKEYRKECILGPAFKLLEAVFELIVPLIIARLVDEGLRQQALPVVYRCVLQLVLMALLCRARRHRLFHRAPP